MKILFDEDAPQPLRRYLPGHTIYTVQEMGWAGVTNGRLLDLAEADGCEILLTFDQNLQHQQNLVGRSIAVVVVVVPNTRMDTLVPLAQSILSAIASASPGQVVEVRN